MKLPKNEIKQIVRESYAKTALSGSSCCDSSGFTLISDLSRKLDYSEEDMAGGLGDFNLGLGCGNPVTEADLRPGETVVDLGCGAGFDAFLSAKKVGIEGVDALVAVTQGDNRNVMAAQIAKHIFGVPKVVCRIYDPLRRDIYEALGLEAISPTVVFAEMLKDKLLSM